MPLGIVALVFAPRALPRTPLARHRFDWLSAMLSAGTFGALIIGIDNLRRLTVSVAFELAGAAVAGALFIWRQRMLAYPMLAVELFARPVFALSVVSSICSFGRIVRFDWDSISRDKFPSSGFEKQVLPMHRGHCFLTNVLN